MVVMLAAEIMIAKRLNTREKTNPTKVSSLGKGTICNQFRSTKAENPPPNNQAATLPPWSLTACLSLSVNPAAGPAPGGGGGVPAGTGGGGGLLLIGAPGLL